MEIMNVYINVDEGKTCSISRSTGSGIMPNIITGLTPEQAVQAKKAMESVFELGRKSAFDYTRDMIPR